MKKTVAAICAIVLLPLFARCSSGGGASAGGPVTLPGSAALQIDVDPNPIVARSAGGDYYEFPFVISLRELNGLPVSIDRVRMDVYALGGALRVYDASYSRAEIAKMGYPTSVEGKGQIRYTLNPRKEVADDRLFGGVEAVLRVEGTDSAGNRVVDEERVTVRR
jgi:hypothetical protein